MYLGDTAVAAPATASSTPFLTALPGLLTAGAQFYQSTQRPTGATPTNFGVPQYQMPQQHAGFGFGDPMTMAMIAGGALLLMIAMKR